MTRKRKRPRRATKQEAPPQRTQATPPIKQKKVSTTTSFGGRLKKKIATVVGILLGLCGLVFAVWTYCEPKISVSPSSSLDPENPFKTPFVVTNAGNWPITDVQNSSAVQKITYRCPDGVTIYLRGQSNFQNREIPIPMNFHPIMLSNESCVITLPEELSYPLESPAFKLAKNRVTYAQIAIIIEFKLRYIPVAIERRFQFSTIKNNEGRLTWIPAPINENSN